MITPKFLFIYSVIIAEISTKVIKNKVDLCNNLACDEKKSVCAIRIEGKGFVLKLYDNECKMIEEECGQDNKIVYEVISLRYCNSAFKSAPKFQNQSPNSNKCHITNCPHPRSNSSICGIRQDGDGFRIHQFQGKCQLWTHNCKHNVDFVEDDYYLCEEPRDSSEIVEKIVPDEPVEIDTPEFQTKISDTKKSIDNEHEVAHGSDYIADKNTNIQEIVKEIPDNIPVKTEAIETKTEITIQEYVTEQKISQDEPIVSNTIPTDTTQIEKEITTPQNYLDQIPARDGRKMGRTINVTNQRRDAPIVVIVDNMLTFKHRNISRRVDDFFETTHVLDLPLQEASEHSEEGGRRMWIRNAGAVKVFKPWITVPKNISDDFFHRPTLSSCYHKCPFRCPNTYAPVCGVPGQIAREPSLMFQNHCFMDVAQCKMRWEDKSHTAQSSAYKETSFVFCLGDELNSLYRFLPLIKTLQHMGRLKKKAYFREKIINMRFLNNIITRQPKLMG